MAYTLEELAQAVRNTVPELEEGEELSHLRQAAVVLFENDQCDCPDALIIREALNDLKHHGHFCGNEKKD